MRSLLRSLLLVLPTALLACDGEEPDTPLIPPDKPESYEFALLDEATENHLLPLYVDVDSDGRRAWCVSRLLGSIAEVDLDTAELVRVLPRYESPNAATRIVGDGPDDLWVLRAGAPPLLHVYPDNGYMQAIDTGMVEAYDLLRLDDDRVLLAGGQAGGPYTLQVLNGQDEVELQEDLANQPVQLERVDDTTVAVLMDCDHIDLRSTEDLSILQSHPAPFTGHLTGNTLVTLGTGDFALSSTTSVGLIDVDADEAHERVEGNENWDVAAIGDEFVVLDRIGPDEPNRGVMRRYDADLELVGDIWPTGKNSGFGGIDEQTGLVWMNSEGTSDLWAVDPDDGAIVHRVPMGVHVESMASHPDQPSRIYISGRLSGTLMWIDLESEEQVHADVTFDWPVVPTILDGRLWVLDQLNAHLHELDLDSLEPLAEHDLGLSVNVTLTLSDMVAHADRGTLLLTHGGDDLLVEVDPSDGSVTNTWDLGGDVLDKDESGRLEVLVGEDGVWVVRSADGRVNRIDLDSSAVTATASPVAGLIPQETRLRYSALADDGSVLYVGPYAIDPSTLVRREDEDRAWTFAIARFDGIWMAWRGEDASVLLLDDDGAIFSVLPTEITSGAQAPEFLWLPRWEERLMFTDIRRAGIVSWPMKTD